jgi:hypothetical protein
VKLFDFNTGPNVAAITKGDKQLQALLHKDVLLVMKRYLEQRYTKLKTHID